MTNETGSDVVLTPPNGAEEDAQAGQEDGSSPTEEEVPAVVLGNLKDMLEGASVFDYEGEVGGTEVLPRPDVDLTLYPSRGIPVAGELWSIAGEIHNRSKSQIWIVDRRTVLTLAPEMWGQTSQRGSMGAFFPTTKGRQEDEMVRVDPGAKYTVVWKINTLEGREKDANSFRQVLRGIWAAVKDFSFFNPGKFRISSTVHVWSSPPRYSKGGLVTNIGDSFPISVAQDIEMEASPWVLILGATVGGVLCFLLQLLFGMVALTGSWSTIIRTVAVGLGSATILCGVATVLISRLAKTDFLVVVKVKDIWGAIATGFIIQWFGYEALVKLLPKISQ